MLDFLPLCPSVFDDEHEEQFRHVIKRIDIAEHPHQFPAPPGPEDINDLRTEFVVDLGAGERRAWRSSGVDHEFLINITGLSAYPDARRLAAFESPGEVGVLPDLHSGREFPDP